MRDPLPPRLVRCAPGPTTEPLIQHAGQDLSHWFNAQTNDVKTCIDPDSGLEVPYLPHGRFVHVPPNEPSADWRTDYGLPWWLDDKQFMKGLLSKKRRYVRIVNTLTSQNDLLEVATEETLEEIRQRYLKYNLHAGSYTWKRLGAPLDLTKTLDQNGIPEETDAADQLLNGSSDEVYVPAIHVYFKDDLTVC